MSTPQLDSGTVSKNLLSLFHIILKNFKSTPPYSGGDSGVSVDFKGRIMANAI